jgi:hypothetical protein
MVYSGNTLREILAIAALLFIVLFGLYAFIRLAVAIFGQWRKALFFACTLWALLMPLVIGVIAAGRYGYRDDNAKHALVAKLYDLGMKRPPGAPELIDLGSSCYPPYTGRSCWIAIVRPQSQDDLDIAQDAGDWHPIKSKTLRSLMPAHVEYGDIAVTRITAGVYSVLSHDYDGW